MCRPAIALSPRQVPQRRGIGGRRLGAFAGNQVELGQLLTLVGRSTSVAPRLRWLMMSKIVSSRLSGGVAPREDGRFADESPRAAPGGSANRQPPARDRERTCIARKRSTSSRRPLPIAPRGRPPPGPEHDRERCDLGDVAETSKRPQRRPGLARQARQLADHEVNDIVGVALGLNAIEIPRPAMRSWSNASNSSSASACRNWITKNGLPPVFVMHQLRQWRGVARLATNASAVNCPIVIESSGAKLDLADLRPRGPDGVEFSDQRMRGVDLIVPIGADQQQVSHIRLDQ